MALETNNSARGTATSKANMNRFMACLPFWAYATPTQAVTKTKATVRPPYTSQPTIPQRFSSLPPAYPELFALVGPQVPDLRGLFLRGHGGNSDALGVRQGDAIRNITGSFTGTYTGISGVFYRITGGDIKAGSEGELIGFDVSRQVPTANEDRPANQAVRYLIRAFP